MRKKSSKKEEEAAPRPQYTEEQLSQMIDISEVHGDNEKVILYTQMRDAIRKKATK